MIEVLLGNAHTHVATKVLDNDGQETGEVSREYVEHPDAVTTVHLPDGLSLVEALGEVAVVWDMHGAVPPLWVECPDWPTLAAVLADEHGCPVGRPL